MDLEKELKLLLENKKRPMRKTIADLVYTVCKENSTLACTFSQRVAYLKNRPVISTRSHSSIEI